MRRNTLAVDAGIAVVIAAFVLIVSPGLAVTGILAILVLVTIAINIALESRKRRRSYARRSSERRPPRRR